MKISLAGLLLGSDYNSQETERRRIDREYQFRRYAVDRVTSMAAGDFNDAISIEAGEFRVQRVRQAVERTGQKRLPAVPPAPALPEPYVSQRQIGEGMPGLLRLPSGRFRKFGNREWKQYQERPTLLPPGFEIYQLPSPGVEVEDLE